MNDVSPPIPTTVGGSLPWRGLQFLLRKPAQRTITRRGLKTLHDQIFRALTSK